MSLGGEFSHFYTTYREALQRTANSFTLFVARLDVFSLDRTSQSCLKRSLERSWTNALQIAWSNLVNSNVYECYMNKGIVQEIYMLFLATRCYCHLCEATLAIGCMLYARGPLKDTTSATQIFSQRNHCTRWRSFESQLAKLIQDSQTDTKICIHPICIDVACQLDFQRSALQYCLLC